MTQCLAPVNNPPISWLTSSLPVPEDATNRNVVPSLGQQKGTQVMLYTMLAQAKDQITTPEKIHCILVFGLSLAAQLLWQLGFLDPGGGSLCQPWLFPPPGTGHTSRDGLQGEEGFHPAWQPAGSFPDGEIKFTRNTGSRRTGSCASWGKKGPES